MKESRARRNARLRRGRSSVRRRQPPGRFALLRDGAPAARAGAVPVPARPRRARRAGVRECRRSARRRPPRDPGRDPRQATVRSPPRRRTRRGRSAHSSRSQQVEQLREPVARRGGHRDALALVRERGALAAAASRSTLLNTSSRRFFVEPEVARGSARPPRSAPSWRGSDGVHDVEQEVGVVELLERRAERVHEVRRQVADEAHRVGDDHLAVAREAEPAARRVERREQLVLGEHLRVGERVEQRATCRRSCSRRSRAPAGRGRCAACGAAGGSRRAPRCAARAR